MAVPLNGGTHTLRHIEAGILQQLAQHRTSLEERLQECLQHAVEEARRRSEERFGPPLINLKERIDAEIPSVREAGEAEYAYCTQEIQNIRSERKIDSSNVRNELAKIHGEILTLRSSIEQHANAITDLERAKQELGVAIESVRTYVNDTAADLRASIAESVGQAVDLSGEKWGHPLQQKVDASHVWIHELEQRSRKDMELAMDTTKMAQEYLLSCIEQHRRATLTESRNHAAEAAAILREDILSNPRMEELMKSPLDKFQLLWDARLSDCRSQLLDKINSSAAEALATASERSETKMSEVATSFSEEVETMRHALVTQARDYSEATQKLSAQLRDTKTNMDAANALTQKSVENLRGHVESLADRQIQLQGELSVAQRAASNGVSSLRVELQREATRFQKFEEVSMPNLLTLVERKTDEGENRIMRATLDYTERLLRLPIGSKTDEHPRTPSTTFGSSGVLAGTSSTYSESTKISAGKGLFANEVSPHPPLPPLTPTAGRITKSA